MTIYRTQVKIIADVLSAVRHPDYGEDGVGVTTILRKANLPYTRLTKLLKELVSSGLLEEYYQGKNTRYKISDKGLEFLHVYRRFEEFAETFGLKL